MPSRFCLECGQLYSRDSTGTWRCPRCQPAADASRRARAAAGRPSSAARGYGPVYRRRRDAIVRQALQLGQPCGICGRLLDAEGRPVSVAHHPRGRPHLADQATCELVPAHASCNSGWHGGHGRTA